MLLQLLEYDQVSLRQIRVRVDEVVEELFVLLGSRWVLELELSVLLGDVLGGGLRGNLSVRLRVLGVGSHV